MIEKGIVYQLVREGLAGTDCFIVDVQVKPDNVIIVEIDNKEGVDIDRCVSLHRFIESHLDRDTEDYELEVGSAGITSPFKVIEQYQKNIGNEVEVLTKAGMKLNGILKSVSDDKFVITIIKKVKTETSKRKVEVEEDLTFGYDEIKYTKYLIRFK
ncbi:MULTISPECIES: ribosome assembly cofactor RimP [Bacteroidales]|uniref:Ribosome maturation factor RimP n=1 Tax=Coprobacter secundus subsp. similis TaxID=2751153 RepID=A0A7G1HZC8_9BACT|nr:MULTISPECIES: ribosome assembly cofactor RimP [Bacteroidales]BCI63558.1 ribosome maturation factor RimP [Coprobacter secundus subsp. similis]CCY39502.1 ribosome maturation factor RimP [Tannerella sp. CAG:118]